MSARPFIIAELSANHLGRLERAIALVAAAWDAGADAVKLQTWSQMTIDGRTIDSGPWAGRGMRELYEEARTPWGWHQPLFEAAANLGIECFASAFDPESVDFLEGLGCPRYKVASFEITDVPLIRYIAQTSKPMIISTGMATEREIAEAYAAADASGCTDITLLKCTSAYPAKESNLLTMVDLARKYGRAGFSDHTIGIGAPVAAAALGAVAIEKHLTLSRAAGGPDAGFSAEREEFKAMVTACREAAAALGKVTYGPAADEMVSLQFRRGLYFTRDLAAGAVIVHGDVRSYRPAAGLPPKDLPRIIGAKLCCNVSRGTPVTEGLIE